MIFSGEDDTWLSNAPSLSAWEIFRHRPDQAVALNRNSETFPYEPTPGPGVPPLLYVKRYWYRGIGRQIKMTLRGSLFGRHRARKEYEILLEMRRRGVNAVRPIAYGTKRKWGLLKASFLITEGQFGTESLDHFIASVRRNKWARNSKHECIGSLGRAVRHMHASGVAHGALFWRNILIQTAEDGGYQFHFVDPDTRSRLDDGEIDPKFAFVDLANLFASCIAAEYRVSPSRFMRAYLGKPVLDEQDRALVRKLVSAGKQMAPAERHRITMSEVMSYLRRGSKSGRHPSRSDGAIGSIDEFFRLITTRPWTEPAQAGRPRTVEFVLTGSGDADLPRREMFRIEGGEVRSCEQAGDEAELIITTDETTWLAIVNRAPEAIDLIRQGRLRRKGDTELLVALARHASR